MPSEYDYGIQFRQFHQDTKEYAEKESESILSVLSPHLPAGKEIDVLDIGCGMGFAMLAFKKSGYRSVFGVDIDRSQIEACRSLSLDVEQIDSLNDFLKERVGKFGLITLIDVLEHIPQDAALETVKHIYAALTPNGRLIIRVPNANSLVWNRWHYNDFTHRVGFTEISIAFVLKNAGFGMVSVPALDNIEPRPSLRPGKLFSSGGWIQIQRWIIRRVWRRILSIEFGEEQTRRMPLGLNLFAVADKSGELDGRRY